MTDIVERLERATELGLTLTGEDEAWWLVHQSLDAIRALREEVARLRARLEPVGTEAFPPKTDVQCSSDIEPQCTQPWTVCDGVPYCDICGLYRSSKHQVPRKARRTGTRPLPSEPPTWDDLRGVAPNATGTLTSEAFVRQLRDEWPDPQSKGTGARPVTP